MTVKSGREREGRGAGGGGGGGSSWGQQEYAVRHAASPCGQLAEGKV